MCGIAGILKRKTTLHQLEAKPILNAMGDQIAHRGPDDKENLIQGPLGVTFRRLSIVDVQGGKQPIWNEDGSIALLVNGEIYNYLELKKTLKDKHLFRTNSDSEIIIHLYEEMGLDFLQQLNGMFALMLWDKRKNQLILARDRLGIKPLYYNINKDRLIFASEIKALLAYPDCPREYDWEEALAYRRIYASPSNSLQSFFKEIEYLPGGSLLIFDCNENKCRVETWWKLAPLSQDEYAEDCRSDEDIIQGYYELLNDSVQKRLMSDVEVGIFLSGGIDSSAITYLSSQTKKLHTFTHLNMSTLKNGDSKGAHIMAKALGLPNHQIYLLPTEDRKCTAEDWKYLLWLTETHLCYAEQLLKYQLHQYAKTTRPDLKVILLGQGSDEFNGGYSIEMIKLAGLNVSDNYCWLDHTLALNALEKKALRWQGNAAIADHGDFLNREFTATINKKQLYDLAWFYNIDMNRQSLQHYNLWHEDRTAAGNHIENRVPFLDHRLVEYCVNIPPSKHSSLFWKKNILSKAMKGRIPESIRTRPKQPFFCGANESHISQMMYEILTHDNNALISEVFSEGDHPVLDRLEINIAVSTIPYLKNMNENVPYLFQLINMGLLDKMAKDAGRQINSANLGSELSSIEIQDWEKEKKEIELKLTRPITEINMDDIISFTSGVFLMKPDQNQHVNNENHDEIYIVFENTIISRLSEQHDKQWLLVLRNIDGRKTLKQILKKSSLSKTEIRFDLEKSLKSKIVVLQTNISL